jgi:phosphoglycolate phosphatase
MNYKALVFDMDGTLLNTLEDLADATNTALAEHGFAAQPTEAYRYFVGSGARNLVMRALPEKHRDSATVEACLATYKKHYNANWASKTHVYSGVKVLLDTVIEKKLALAILTNKPQAFADQCVEHFLADWHWQVVQGQIEGVAIKPSAEISNRVTQQLNVAPEEVLYIGDSNVDMDTAKNAGYTSVSVTWGFRTEQELRDAGANHLVHSPAEILELL